LFRENLFLTPSPKERKGWGNVLPLKQPPPSTQKIAHYSLYLSPLIFILAKNEALFGPKTKNGPKIASPPQIKKGGKIEREFTVAIYSPTAILFPKRNKMNGDMGINSHLKERKKEEKKIH